MNFLINLSTSSPPSYFGAIIWSCPPFSFLKAFWKTLASWSAASADYCLVYAWSILLWEWTCAGFLQQLLACWFLPTKITVLKDVMLCDQVASHHCGESLSCIICWWYFVYLSSKVFERFTWSSNLSWIKFSGNHLWVFAGSQKHCPRIIQISPLGVLSLKISPLGNCVCTSLGFSVRVCKVSCI